MIHNWGGEEREYIEVQGMVNGQVKLQYIHQMKYEAAIESEVYAKASVM